MSHPQVYTQVSGSGVTVKNDTEYVVLRSEAAGVSWTVVGKFFARTAGDAAKAAHEKRALPPSNGSTYVAVPSRSWKAVRVTPKVETTLMVEEVGEAVADDD